jgi:hypothetical protein
MATKKRAYTAPIDSERCIANAVTAAGNEGGRCMHRSRYGRLCQQHAANAYPKLIEALQLIERAFWTDGESKAECIADLRSIAKAALRELGGEA